MRPGGHVVYLDRFAEHDDDKAAHVRFRSVARWDDIASRHGLRRDVLVPAYRWLSREVDAGPLARAPQRIRGPLEFVLERIAPRDPHMRCARYVRLS